VIRKIQTRKSPRFKAFYNKYAVTLTLDTGAETNMIKASLAHFLGVNVKKSSHTAFQADGLTPLPDCWRNHVQYMSGEPNHET